MRLPKIHNVDRKNIIIKSCKDKIVLDVGCTAAPHTQERFEKKKLIHLDILKVAKQLVGMDIDCKSIKYLKQKGVQNLYHFDAEKLEDFDINMKFDVIIAGQIIEHLKNPGLFLEGAKQLLKPKGYLIITVPNAISIKRIIKMIFRIDAQSPYHSYSFTGNTLKKLLNLCGLEIKEFNSYYVKPDTDILQRNRSKIINFILKKLPVFNYYADGFIVKAGIMKINNKINGKIINTTDSHIK